MYLSYKKIGFAITLSKKVWFSIPIPFLFRSIIGYQLRKMCCIARAAVCGDCMFNASCIYGQTFESIVPKNNTALAGRDHISHPIIIDADNFAEETLDSLFLSIIFLGSTIPYFPYFYYALVLGGEAGIARERVPYQVSDIFEFTASGEKRSIKINEQKIETSIEPDKWECDPEPADSVSKDQDSRQEQETGNENKYTITLLSPLRFKTQGSYANRLVDSELAKCLHRRTQVLCSQYGRNDYPGKYLFSGGWTVEEQNVKWKDFTHYSARQKKVMQLGGLLGNFVLSGSFSSYERSFLRFAEKFHGGKNTNFGLGKMKVAEYGRV